MPHYVWAGQSSVVNEFLLSATLTSGAPLDQDAGVFWDHSSQRNQSSFVNRLSWVVGALVCLWPSRSLIWFTLASTVSSSACLSAYAAAVLGSGNPCLDLERGVVLKVLGAVKCSLRNAIVQGRSQANVSYRGSTTCQRTRGGPWLASGPPTQA